MFLALARFCYRRRRLVVAAWVVALVATNVLSASLGPNFSTNFTAPNTESSRATALLGQQFKAVSGDTVQVTFRGSPSMQEPALRTQVAQFRAALAEVPHVTGVSDPYTTPGAISKSGTIALANAQLDTAAHDIPNSVGRQMIDLAEQKVFEVSFQRGMQEVVRIKELMWDTMERIEARHRGDESVRGVMSGFKDLDERTNGFHPSDLIIIASQLGSGR